MPKRPLRASLSSPTGIDPTLLRAHGRQAPRFRGAIRGAIRRGLLSPDHLRGPTVSSIGIGTYLGDNTDADDAAYRGRGAGARSRSGINLIDTAINYRSQRSERAIGAAIQQILAAGYATRDELVICSKGGYIPLDRTPPATREEYQHYVRREFIDQQILQAG